MNEKLLETYLKDAKNDKIYEYHYIDWLENIIILNGFPMPAIKEEKATIYNNSSKYDKKKRVYFK